MASGWHRKVNDAAAQARAAEYRTPEYRAARAVVKRQVEACTAHCWRCGRQLVPGHWHLGHSDTDRTRIMGGECATCNLRAAASKGARIANARRKTRVTGSTALRM